TKPSGEELRLWCNSFLDLVTDRLGAQIFRDFLRTEFSAENLDFWLRVRALDSVAAYDDFVAAAIAIFDEFIPTGAPQELNITSQMRKDLVAAFAPFKGQSSIVEKSGKRLRLNPRVFSVAQDHIYHLMAKDSFQRFLASEVLGVYLVREGIQVVDESGASVGPTGSKLKKLAA
ncbi:hypothetical protein HK405_010263, partial [Cladochytrium tenue]